MFVNYNLAVFIWCGWKGQTNNNLKLYEYTQDVYKRITLNSKTHFRTDTILKKQKNNNKKSYIVRT